MLPSLSGPRCRFTPQRPRNLSRQIPAGKHRHITLFVDSCQNIPQRATQHSDRTTYTRRAILLPPLFLATGACLLRQLVSSAEGTSSPVAVTPPPPSEREKEEAIESRIYDATAIGEPMAVGKDKRKVWEKLMNTRVMYLGEAEQVPIIDDKDLELEIVRNLRKRCVESQRQIAFAMEAFPCDLQDQLNQYIEKSDRLIIVQDRRPDLQRLHLADAMGVLRTVQAEGICGLSKSDRKIYAPPAGSGFITGFTSISCRSLVDMNSPTQCSIWAKLILAAQARVVEKYIMSQIILQALVDGGGSGMLVVVTGASHVQYGSRGTGLPARISKKMQKKKQVVVLLDPERQYIRREGEVHVADFLWYSASRPCIRNCFDRDEIARVMNAAGRRQDALPQDLQKGLDLGLVSPEVLQNFLDLEQYPIISELTYRFQGFRERRLADPKFLHRLAISITTTLLAQYKRRKENFLEELDYVITDTARGIVVDFFTVWLPAPTLSFVSYTDEINVPDNMDALKGLLGSILENAFQKSLAGKDWNLSQRVASVLVGGLKLASVGFISNIGAVAASNFLYAIRKFINQEMVSNQQNKRSPILKTAIVYGVFLGTSANLCYQTIAGVIEHRISDGLSSQTLLVNMLSFLVRTINFYWGTQQRVDLARFSGL